MVNLVFLLDITASMGSELHGVKATVARLVKTVFTTENTTQLMVTIITFTEDPTGCYVTRHSFTDGHEATKFVNKIRLCVPPGSYQVNANGGDGPENHKAALAELLRLDSATPTIAFLITDAIPHLLGKPSTEATLESQWLSHTHGLANTDLFEILTKLDAHFGVNLVLSVIKYNTTSAHALYGAVAKRFNGVLITPQLRSPEQLANGLMAILMQLFHAIGISTSSESAHTNDKASTKTTAAAALEAFRFYDLKHVVVPETEQGRRAIVAPEVGSTDELLFQLVERTTVIAGDKFKKRAITAHLVSEQVELMLVVAKGLLRAIPIHEALPRASLLLTTIRTRMGDEHASQFKLRVDELEALLSNEAFGTTSSATTDMEAAVSAITLLSVEETARDVAAVDGDTDQHEPRDPYSSLLAVASLFLGHLAVLELPKRQGVVDFMDAWSAKIHKVANDTISAADFLTMIGDQSSVAGLSLRDREYNFLQLVADPRDALGSELLRVASGTQVLDILTALLSGAPAGLFSPNMFRGTISACLMTLLSPSPTYGGNNNGSGSGSGVAELSAFEWEIAHKMVHTMRLIMSGATTQLALEPESAMAKLLFRLVRLTANKKVHEIDELTLRSFLEEMAAARAMQFAKLNERGYFRLVETMVAYSHDTAAALENVFASHVLVDTGDTLAFDAKRAVKVVAQSGFCRAFERSAGNVLRALFPHEAPPSLTQIWPAYTQDLAKLLLLHKRTERYTLVTCATTSDKIWERNDAVMAAALGGDGNGNGDDVFGAKAMALLRLKYAALVREIRKQRQNQRAQERWYEIVAFLFLPLSQFLAQLSTVVRSSSRQEHKLLLRAFQLYAHELQQSEYEAKVAAVLTGRTLKTGRIVFNRGNLHPHPDRVVPLTREFKATLRELQRTHKWSTAHVYRESGLRNRNGFSTSKPSAWAVNCAWGKRTFWDGDDDK